MKDHNRQLIAMALMPIFCWVVAYFWTLHIGIPLYKHFFQKPIGIEEAKQMPTITERHVYIPAHKPIIRNHYGNAVDTLESGETIYFYASKKGFDFGNIELTVIADSISGATNATVYFEESKLGLIWKSNTYRYDSYHINGNKQQHFDNATLLGDGDNIRARIVADDHNQKTRLEFKFAYK